MARRLKNWLNSYMEYTQDTESAKVFHRWVGISAISAALMKKAYLALGRLKVCPNTYVVLVSEPGIARKSQAITFGEDIIANVQSIKTTPDAITKEALIVELAGARRTDFLPDGDIYSHCSVSIISKEFESFLGQKKENTKLLVFLTDLFDAREGAWTSKTKSAGNYDIVSPYLTILGATTPESLASSLPPQAIGGGLTSRIIYVWADKREKKVAKPTISPAILQLRDDLIYDLDVIQKIAGKYEFSPDADIFWLDWYDRYDERSPTRLCPAKQFTGWYSRKPTYILKLAQIHAAAESNALFIEPSHIKKAIIDVESTEQNMAKVFVGIGRSSSSLDVTSFVSLVAAQSPIPEATALAILYRDMDAEKFKNVVRTAIKAGFVKYINTGKGGFFEITERGREEF